MEAPPVNGRAFGFFMKLLIFGSRTLTGQSVKEIIIDQIAIHKPDMIITAGEPEGVCEMAREVAKHLAIPLKLHFVDNAKYATGKYHMRSIAALKDCDFCLFIHDGTSKGTANEIVEAKKLNVPYSYDLVEVKQPEYSFSICNW